VVERSVSGEVDAQVDNLVAMSKYKAIPTITIMDYSDSSSPHPDRHKPLPPTPPQEFQGPVDKLLFSRSKKHQYLRKGLSVTIFILVLYVSYTFLANKIAVLTLAGTPPSRCRPVVAVSEDGSSGGVESKPKSTSTIPQYFQTSPELWPGPTATGRAPFLAATNPVSFASTKTYVANEPLETGDWIEGMKDGDESIFRRMGHLSGYFAGTEGFGAEEFRLRGAEGERIEMVQVG
jgi:hypothetical protein